MGNLATRLSVLSADRLALLQRRLRAAGSEPTRARITRQPRDRESFALSFAQERLWFLDQMQPHGTAYNIPEVYSFPGPLNVAALERSLSEIVRRHEILRTRFAIRDGVPVQIIAEPADTPLVFVDLRDRNVEDRKDELRHLIACAAEIAFDLTDGPLLRTKLVALGDAEHVLLVTMHHIISDGWSMTIFARELAQLYDACSAGRPSPLPALPIQYVDFSWWQRRYLSGALLENQLSYWKRQLAGAPTFLDLPTDRPRPPMQTFRGAQHHFTVSAEITAAVQALGRHEGATLFMVLLSAFKVLLYRWSGQPDLLVGTLIAGRNRAEIEGLIGFFVNTLVLRTDLSGNPGFRELLRRVRTTTLEGFAHQDLPFEKLVGELRPERRLSHHPLFQVLFAVQNMGAPMPAAESDAAGMEPIASRTAKFDVALFMNQAGSGLAGALEYNIDLFDAATMSRMVSHLAALLAGIAADPDKPILDFPIEAETLAGRRDDPPPRSDILVDRFDFEPSPSA